jgi:hypothetical protein
MTTNVLPIIRINTPNGQFCDVNVYHITMIDCRIEEGQKQYPIIYISNGEAITVTDEEAARIAKAVSKIDKPSQLMRNSCKFKSKEL